MGSWSVRPACPEIASKSCTGSLCLLNKLAFPYAQLNLSISLEPQLCTAKTSRGKANTEADRKDILGMVTAILQRKIPLKQTHLWEFCFVLYYLGSHSVVAQANSEQSSCPSFLTARIIGVNHYTWLFGKLYQEEESMDQQYLPGM